MDKRALVRIVNTPEDGPVVDLTGKRNGRGAYICGQDTCWEQALTTSVLDRALRATLTDADRVRLREQRPR
ncbi:MAG: YlxR family protein [Anaerolineae bacterium]|nr:YlxR family protein [Anaerolineae bacterium]